MNKMSIPIETIELNLKEKTGEILKAYSKMEDISYYQMAKKYSVSRSTIHRRIPELIKEGYIYLKDKEPFEKTGLEMSYYQLTLKGILAFCILNEKWMLYLNIKDLQKKIGESTFINQNDNLKKLISKHFIIGSIKLWLKYIKKSTSFPTIFYPYNDFGLNFLTNITKGIEDVLVEKNKSMASISLGLLPAYFDSIFIMDPPNLTHVVKDYGELKMKEAEDIVKYILGINTLKTQIEQISLMNKYIQDRFKNNKDFWIWGHLPLYPFYISIGIEIDQAKFCEVLNTGNDHKYNGNINKDIIKKIEIGTIYRKVELEEIVKNLGPLWNKYKKEEINIEEFERESMKLPRQPFETFNFDVNPIKNIKNLIAKYNS